MAARSSWKGYLKLSLVSVPVKAYTASSSGGSPIQLNQLHAECHSRIKYQKTCPIHGEVSSDQIVMGYEFAKGQYVVVDTEEINKLRTEGDKSINVTAFVPTDAIDPIYHSGRTYYLTPDGPVGQKPYALLRQSMADDDVCAIGQVVISNKEQLVLVRPIDNLLAMTVLTYEAEVKQPSAFEDELTDVAAEPEEVKLTKMLVQALTKPEIDLSQFKDVYNEKLTQLITSKVEGKELVSPPAEESPQVINLMEALKASVQQVKVPVKTAAAETKPARKLAASKTKRAVAAETPPKTAAPKRKRKSG
jgi:DNA end-binding protein Ku